MFTFPTATVCTWTALLADGAAPLVEDGALSLDIDCECPKGVKTAKHKAVAINNILIGLFV